MAGNGFILIRADGSWSGRRHILQRSPKEIGAEQIKISAGKSMKDWYVLLRCKQYIETGSLDQRKFLSFGNNCMF